MGRTLKDRMHNVISELKDIIQEIQINDLLNEQFSLDFVDEINRLSVSF